MRCAIIIFCAGIVCAAFVVDVPAALESSRYALLIFGLALLLAWLFGAERLLTRLLLYCLLFVLGSLWHLQWANQRLQLQLPARLEGVTLPVEGVVASLPERSLAAQQFQFRVLRSDAGFHPRKIVLNYYGDETIQPGQRWRFSVRLNRPHGFANPGGFDYEGWLFQQGISARGYVRQSAGPVLIAPACAEGGCSASVRIHSLRYSLRTRLQGLTAGRPTTGLLVALVLGDRSAISQADWELFSATGSNHLFVISGLHIGLVSGFSFFLLVLGGRVVGIARLLPVQKFAAAGALAAALFYALLAGFTLPTQRAFIMIAVLMCGLFWNSSYLISFRLLLALLLVLMIDPLAIIGAGFWLSFVAVAALLAFAQRPLAGGYVDVLAPTPLERLQAFAGLFIWPQCIVLAALALPLIFFTGQLSLLSPLVNVVAIPVVGLLIVPLCFLSLLCSFVNAGLAGVVLEIAHGAITALLWCMRALTDWGGSSLQLQHSPASALQFIALLLTALLLLLPRGVCRRTLILPLLLPLWPVPDSLSPAVDADETLRLHILDVGQGLAVVIETAGHALLFDSGANLSPDFNMGSAVVAPALLALGIDRLDAVVISHGDNDHAGGFSGLRRRIRIERLIANAADIYPGRSASRCDAVADWNWDGVEFRFLRTGLDFADENNSSCVLQVRLGDDTVLLPGDIEREAEAALVLRYGDTLASTVMLAPHHGSLSSSSYALLKKVRPDYVVFSSGYHNSFGHPHESIRARYAEFSSRQLSTSGAGMISFDLGAAASPDATPVEPRLYREQNYRYWR